MPVMGEIVQAAPMQAYDGANERTSGVDRSLGWSLRLVPYTLIIFVLTAALVWLADGSWPLLFGLFAGMCLGVYAVLDKREHQHSRAGVERHRIDSVTSLDELREKNAHELRKMWLEVQIERIRADVEAIEGPRFDASRTLDVRE